MEASARLGLYIYGAIHGHDNPLKSFDGYMGLEAGWPEQLLKLKASEISASGYVVDTLKAALWGFLTTNSFEKGALRVANLGDDSDTVGAVYGQIAGAHYGLSSIPQKWLDKLVDYEMIREMADQLFDLNLRVS